MHILVTASFQIVDFNYRLKDRESVLNVLKIVKLVDVNTSYFDLITWSGFVNQIVQHKALLLTRHTTRRHAAWSFLNSQLLVVAVNCVHFI